VDRRSITPFEASPTMRNHSPWTRSLAAALLAIVAPGPLRAQRTPAPTVGPRVELLESLRIDSLVRLHLVGGEYTAGRLAEVAEDSVAVAVAGGAYVVPRAGIDSVWRQRRPSYGRGILRGAAAGAVLTAVFYGLLKSANRDNREEPGLENHLLPYFAIAFVSGGVAIGGLAETGPPWERVYPKRKF
jgi:hypothetical protein